MAAEPGKASLLRMELVNGSLGARSDGAFIEKLLSLDGTSILVCKMNAILTLPYISKHRPILSTIVVIQHMETSL